eukprot:GILJ01009891.1.p1 GENE.GILJ01009891.1~~GILJ01009891.1.p1  ORF type:complete len:596 (-),score=34.79 GILJ01009891.1:114-1901(-)
MELVKAVLNSTCSPERKAQALVALTEKNRISEKEILEFLPTQQDQNNTLVAYLTYSPMPQFQKLSLGPDLQSWADASFQKENETRGHSADGIQLDGDKITFRESTVESFVSRLDVQKMLLVRSPPSSGKTSMTQLLYKWYRDNRPDVLTVSVTCLNWNRGRSPSNPWSFEVGFGIRSGVGMSYSELCEKNPNRQIVIMIDEFQLLYQSIETEIWEFLKKGLPLNLNMIMFAMYGEGGSSSVATPFEFTPDRKLGLPDMLLTKMEFDCIIQKSGLQEYSQVKDMIWNATHGHAGLMKVLITALDEHINSIQRSVIGLAVTEDGLISVLISHAVSRRVSSSRAFFKPSNTFFPILDDLVNGKTVLFDDSHAPLVVGGLVVTETVTETVTIHDAGKHVHHMVLRFSCPLVMRAYSDYRRSFLPIERTPYTMPSHIGVFVRDCLARLDFGKLKLSSSVGSTGLLFESKWQMEFYCAAKGLLEADMHVDPDVGRVFNIDGKLDFYINSTLKWGIEFLVQSRDIVGHHQRFDTTRGRYAGIPMNLYLVVDFIKVSESDMNNFTPPYDPGHVMFVLFTGDFDKLRIVCPDIGLDDVIVPTDS